jgi:rfaE bifunctional protein nucleotidyltransferase chain/domain
VTHPAASKVLTLVDAVSLAREFHQDGRRIVLTNGVFDLLHVGHLRYLQAARALGDALIVGLNSDASTRTLKGPSRPINPEQERAELLAGLACVDGVVIFADLTAVGLVEAIRPDIWVKGGDYGSLDEALPRLPEAATVLRLGGEVRLLPFVEGRSTTLLVERIRGLGDEGMRG